MLIDGAVIRRVEGLKVFRRAGKMLVVSPISAGAVLLGEAEQALFVALSRPQEYKALLSSPQYGENAKTLIGSFYRQGIVQILGKNNADCLDMCRNAVHVRLELPRPADALAQAQGEVRRALAPNRGWVVSESCQSGTWGGFLEKLPDLPLTLEAVLAHPDMLGSLRGILSEAAKSRCVKRVVLHAHLDGDMRTALEQCCENGCLFGIEATAEILAYCPAASLSAYKQNIGKLLKLQLPCLPIGCLEKPSQLSEWFEQALLWRYRSVGVNMSYLLNGDILEGLQTASELVDEWLKIAEEIEHYAQEHAVRLRVHPLERVLVCLGNRSLLKPPQRFEARWLDSDIGSAIQWKPADGLPAACSRCFARGYCAYLEHSELSSMRCWVRKKLFEELLWRWHEKRSALHDLFAQGNAL
ncbi:hypothetical protein IJT17_02310 [bacterium]|nr:hypothetical protein [bacterium]